MSKKALIIINPCAGQKRANKHLTDILCLFTKRGYQCTVSVTQHRLDAKNLVILCAKDLDLIVCVGGDGTLNEVISGLMYANSTVPIGYIPSGSTNDFATGLKLSKDIMHAATDICDGNVIKLDIGLFNDRYFSYVASFGAFTGTSYSTPQPAKNAWGHMAYVFEGLRDITNIRPIHIRIESENSIFDDEYVFGAISNSTTIGGFLNLDAAFVNMNDGKFEITLIRPPQNAADLGKILSSMQTGELNPDVVDSCTVQSARCISDEPLIWTLDGERYDGPTESTVTNIHDAINLIVKIR